MHDALLLIWYTRASAAVSVMALCALVAIVAMLGAVLQRQSRHEHSIAANDTVAEACFVPAYRDLARAPVWLFLGDAILAGNTLREQLVAMAKLYLDMEPQVLQLAGTSALLSTQLNEAHAHYARNGSGVLIFVSYGLEQLLLGAGAGNVSAELRLLGAEPYARVVLIDPPDALYGTVHTDAALVDCLVNPTLEQLVVRRAAFAILNDIYSNLPFARVFTDRQLGRYAWNGATSRADCSFTDCTRYSTFGQTKLASLVWQCLTWQA